MRENISIYTVKSSIIYNDANRYIINIFDTLREKKKTVLCLLSGGSAIGLYSGLSLWIADQRLKTNPSTSLRARDQRPVSEWLAFGQVDERFQPKKRIRNQESGIREKQEDDIDWNEVNAYRIGETGLWDACEKAGISYATVSQEGTLEQSAEEYDAMIRKLIPLHDILIGIFGIGADGHTAGLLPGYQSAWDTAGFAAGYHNNQTFKNRVSITPKTIRMLDEVVVLAAGEEKEPVLKRLQCEEETIIGDFPAAVIRDVSRVSVWTDREI